MVTVAMRQPSNTTTIHLGKKEEIIFHVILYIDLFLYLYQIYIELSKITMPVPLSVQAVLSLQVIPYPGKVSLPL